MRLHNWVCLLVFASLVVCAAGEGAYAQVNTADLSGQVLDPQNLPVVGAKVTVKNLATGAVRSTTADDSGRYQLVGLPPGRYELAVEAGKGLANLINSQIELTIGQSAVFDTRLQLKSGTETVTVTEATELIETSRTAVAETVDRRRIDNLPINGRNYINFTLTTSQAQRDSAPSIGAAPTSGINFGGQRARSNQVSVDGADAGDNSVNGIRATVSQEAVQEFQLIISNYMPEFGRATGGVINIVTKGGANETHGNLFGFLRHKSIQARNAFSGQVDPTTGNLIPAKQAYTRVQGGATIGGPIKKDKTFYFFSYEITRRQETGFSSIGANNFGLVPTTFGGGTLELTPQQRAFITNPAVLAAPGGPTLAGQLFALAGSASSVARTGINPGVIPPASGGAGPGAFFPFLVAGLGPAPLPASFVRLNNLRGNFPTKEATSLWSARLDHQWNARNNSFVRASVSPSLVTGIQVNAQNQNFGQNAGSRTSLQQTRDLAIVGQHVTTLTNNLFNEARFQFARRGLHYGFSQLPGGDGLGVNITGFAFFGREPFSTVDRIERRFQWTDNLSWIKGRHTFKTGVDINLIQLRSKKAQIFELNFGGVVNFGVLGASTFGLPTTFAGVPVPGLSAVQAYGLGLPQTYIQGIGNSARPFENKAFAGFVQDSWKIHPRLTLNYGVRYDIELTPLFPAATAINDAAEKAFNVVEGIPRDFNNVAPRFALAWDPRGNGKTIIRAGYGLFYDHPLLGVAFNAFTAEGALSSQLIIFGGTPSAIPITTNPVVLNGASIFQGVLNTSGITGLDYRASEQRFGPKTSPFFNNQNFLTAGVPITILPFTLPVAGNFVYAYSQQSNLTIEQQLGSNYKLSAGYTYTHGSHLNRPRDINSTDPVLLATNLRNALAAGFPASTSPFGVAVPAASFPASGPFCGLTVVAPRALGTLTGCPGPLAVLNGQFVGTAPFFNFFRPSGPNPSFAALAGGYANQVVLASLAGYPRGFPGVQVPFNSIDNQESTGSSVYHALTVALSKRFSNHFEFLSSYTWSHTIDDSTDLQTLLEPQDNRFPNRERGNSSFDQRHRWVTSAVFQSPYARSSSGAWHKFLADFTIAPIVEVSSGRPYSVLSGTDFRLDLAATQGRASQVASGGITSPFLPGVQFGLPTVCDTSVSLGTIVISPPAGCTGNLGRNTFVRPGFFQWDLRVSRKLYIGEKLNFEFISDMFNLFNRNNTADVNPLCDLSGGPGSTCSVGQPASALDARQFQFGLKINF